MSSMALSAKTIESFGVGRFVVGRFLFKGESEPLNLTFSINGVPVDITNYTLTFRLQKQIASPNKDSKNGYDCYNREPDPLSAELNLDTYLTKTDAVNGKMLLEIPTVVTANGADEWGVPAVYSGFYSLEDNASIGELIQRVPVLVVVK